MENQVVIPGTRIGDAEDYEPGTGTYVRHKYVFSSLVGKVEISGAQGEKPTISVVKSAEPSLVPAVGSIVTGSIRKSIGWLFFASFSHSTFLSITRASHSCESPFC